MVIAASGLGSVNVKLLIALKASLFTVLSNLYSTWQDGSRTIYFE